VRPGTLTVQPGDIGFDGGGGLLGALIRLGSTSPWAHCFVVVAVLDTEHVLTHEAYPGGLRTRVRRTETIGTAVRVWRTAEERRALMARSYELIGTPYAYGEVVRIVGHYLWQRRRVVALGALGAALLGAAVVSVLALGLLALGAASLTRWDTGRAICSNHCSQAALHGRPELAAWLRYEPARIWPGELHVALTRAAWSDREARDG
jgi:hypothetical protein